LNGKHDGIASRFRSALSRRKRGAKDARLIVEDALEIAVIEEIALELGLDAIGFSKNAAEVVQMAGDADIAVANVRLANGLSGPQIAQELVSRYGMGVVFLTGNP
jgi:hypothetical protein